METRCITCKDGTQLYLSKEKYDIAINYKWCVQKSNSGSITMVTYFNGGKKNFIEVVFGVDTKTHLLYHKNGNRLDFTDDNITIVSRSEFGHLSGGRKRKKSKYKGVYKVPNWKWAAKIVKEKKQFFGGYYVYEFEAGLVADFMTKKHFGEKVNLNFPMLTMEQLEEICQLIEDKYGSSASGKKSKSLQGKARFKRPIPVGVTYIKDRDAYMARIEYMGKVFRTIRIKDKDKAGVLYDEKALELYGTYAKLNNPIDIVDKVKETFTKYTGIENPT